MKAEILKSVQSLCREYRIESLYVFGSRAKEVFQYVHGTGRMDDRYGKANSSSQPPRTKLRSMNYTSCVGQGLWPILNGKEGTRFLQVDFMTPSKLREKIILERTAWITKMMEGVRSQECRFSRIIPAHGV